MAKRLKVSLRKQPAMKVHRSGLESTRLCYVITVNKRMKYTYGRSHIVYIGTTSKGTARIAQSAAAKAKEVLALHGVKELEVRIVTCRARKNVRSWLKLERALLLTFRGLYGEIPKCNKQGKKMRLKDEFDYFAEARLRNILRDLGS